MTAQFLSQTARQWPSRPALFLPVRRGRCLRYEVVTFGELEEQARRAQVLLERRGIARGDRVLIMVHPGAELITLVFALFRVGAVPLVIDPGMGMENFLRCVRQSQPTVLIGNACVQGISYIFLRKWIHKRLWVTGKFFKNLQKFSPNGAEECRVVPDSLAAILFTSGSTGAPKGVCYTHAHFAAQVDLLRGCYAIGPEEIDLPLLPVFALFNPALGMATVVPEMNPRRPATLNPSKAVQAIQVACVTNSFGSPTLWTKIGRYCQQKGIQLPSLRRIFVAGTAVHPALVQLLKSVAPQAIVQTPYGATEVLPVTTITGDEILKNIKEGGFCVGKPVPGMQVRIIPVQAGPLAVLPDAVPEQEVGEICVCGPVVTTHYHGLPEATLLAKVRDSEGRCWHRMGDLGRLDSEQKLWFYGRKAERVYTAHGVLDTVPCERIFSQHPWVARAALIGLGPDHAQVPAIVIEPIEGHFPNTSTRATFEKELRQLGQGSLATRNIEHFFFHKKMPVDVRHNAKIHRLTLARFYNKKFL